MPFTPKDWTDGSAGGTPITAAELERIEGALAKVWDRTGGVVNFDDASFGTGLTDDQKHVAGWNYARNATRKPVMQYPDRTFGPLSTPIATFSGMRAIGPIGMDGAKNQELASGNLVNHKVDVACGSGTSSLFVQTTDINDIVFANISYKGTNTSQWWHNTNPTVISIYPGVFHSLAFDNFLTVLGNDANKFTMTQCVFSGHWTVLNSTGTPIHLGGSDNQLWMGGYINCQSPTSVPNTGKPLIWFDFLEKTSIGYMYLTNDVGWRGLLVQGPVLRGIRIYGGVFEGKNAGSPATAANIDIQGGHVIMFGPDVGQITTANGAITQSGGVLELYSPHYRKATAAATTYPLLYQTGGVASVYKPFNGDGNAVRIHWKDATLGAQDMDVPYPTGNSIDNWTSLDPGMPFTVTGSRASTGGALASLLTQLETSGLITNSTTATPFSVTGSRAGNTALASLLTQLAAAGIITDSTSV